jgi:DNA-binding MarR family transcriptional regulator
MLNTIIRNAAKSTKYLTTYNSGLLQTKAYRILKKHITHHLTPYALSSVEWALLGQLYDHKQMRIADLAEALDVEGPFITRLVNDLIKRNWLTRIDDSADARVRLVTLTSDARKKIPLIEKDLRSKTKTFLKGISIQDLLGYISVLEFIVEKNK